MAAPNYTLPQFNTPLVDKNGVGTFAFLQFLRQLFLGTGSGVPLGTAANKNASNANDPTVASVTTPVVVGHAATYADTAGTLQDGGALGTAASQNTGTSGGTIPLLNGNNTWSGIQTITSGDLALAGATSGTTVLNATAVASGTLTLPAATDTLTGKATTDILTNKTISGASNTLSNISPSSILSAPITNSLSGDVSLTNTANYFDGPSVAQGATGVWFVSGTVTVWDTAGAASILAKLWDGTTVIDSAAATTAAASFAVSITLSGFLTSPASNLKISVRDATSTSGVMLFNRTGLSMDSTITAFRIK